MRCHAFVAATMMLAAPALAQSPGTARLNPVVDLLEQKRAVFGLYAPANPRVRPGEAAAVQSATKTPWFVTKRPCGVSKAA